MTAHPDLVPHRSPGGPASPTTHAPREAICATCGVQRQLEGPAPACPVCEDERQYVGAGGQRWTTLAELAASHRNTVTEVEPGLHSIRTTPAFAIAQRALVVQTPHGNVLWDCLSLVDDATVDAVQRLGGLAAIAISHPHFYGVMRTWSRAFGGAPIWIHEADRAWIPAPAPEVRAWTGERTPVLGELTLTRVGGHFDGSQVLHWPAGAGGRGALLVGDMPNVCADRRWVTFMRSYPNYLPVADREAAAVVAALRPLAFDRIYGWLPDRVVDAGAKAVLERSLDRMRHALRGEHDVVASAAPA